VRRARPALVFRDARKRRPQNKINKTAGLQYFPDDDIKALAQFYATPAGQHFNEHSADTATDSMKLGQEFAAANMGRIFAQICSDYPELQGKAQFCSASVAERPAAPSSHK